jgi:predicted phosphodiesterase
VIAALYDIHGNLPALEAVLGEVRSNGADRIVVGGDVLPGPQSIEVLDLLLELDIPADFIVGNCEVAALAERDGRDSGVPARFRETMQRAAAQLTDAHVRAITSWPKTLRMQVDGVGDVLFCHATPRDENEIVTPATPDDQVAPIFVPPGAAVVVCGHTHVQYDRRVGPVRIVNAGSVGMPFEGTGAHWLTLGPDVKLRRTEHS